MKTKMAILFGVIYIVTLIFFFPVRYVVGWLELPDTLDIQAISGSVWKGSGYVTIEALGTKLNLDITWRTCLATKFPFYSNCLTIANRELSLSGKIVGVPMDQLFISSLVGRVDLAGMAALSKEIIPLVVFANPQGSVNMDLSQIHYSIQEQRPLSWQGTIRLGDLAIFGVELPDVIAQLTQAPFVSQNTRETLFADQDLPSFRFSGGDERLGVQGQGQFLPDRQVKVTVESTVLDNSLRPALATIASRRQGNKYFWEYQGAYSLDQNQLTD